MLEQADRQRLLALAQAIDRARARSRTPGAAARRAMVGGPVRAARDVHDADARWRTARLPRRDRAAPPAGRGRLAQRVGERLRRSALPAGLRRRGPATRDLDQRAVAARGDPGGQRGGAHRGAGARGRRPRARARRRARDVPARCLADAAGPRRLRGAAEVQGRLVGVVLVAGACARIGTAPRRSRLTDCAARRRASPRGRGATPPRRPWAFGICCGHGPAPGAPRRPWSSGHGERRRRFEAHAGLGPLPAARARRRRRAGRRPSSRRATWRAGGRWNASG